MPKRLEDALKRSAKKQGIEEGSERFNAYVYGSLNRILAERSKDDDHVSSDEDEKADK